ncbi:SagB family peptide dehydrogenase [Sphingobacterium bambusae]|uniref:SagB family peptide dehydrogenase n=1 Tax=Sphingobacterium bambusae TaxID=662858 RepID=A0ABW6BL99_9SPHI|nr:SagB family peptide dehydrogenase [Sphingobacterium bambusae]WPL51005.1 SagB family peptide dehydrogenase [Sphingobacterium bambusae]
MIFTNNLFNDYISSCTRDFIETSKLQVYDVQDYAMHISGIMSSDYYMKEIFNSTLELGNVKTVALPAYESSEALRIWHKINKARRCIRHFSATEQLNLHELSSLLQNTLFISRVDAHGNDVKHRNIPSPGGLYPIDLYYLNLKAIDGLEVGAYYYDLHQGSLKKVSDETIDAAFREKVFDAFSVTEGVPTDIDFFNASGVVILGGTLNRTAFKYLDRGIKWVFTEAGSLMNNIQLVATAQGGVGTCPCAGFIDDAIAEIINFRSIDQVPIISIVVGKPVK